MILADVIEQTRRRLLTGDREEQNKLNGAIDNVVTSLAMTYPLNAIKRGAKLSIDLEDMYVWGTSSLTVSPVDRGQFGSTAAAHIDGSRAYVNSKFSPFDIFTAINEELVSLSAPNNGLYHITTTILTYNPVINGYSFPYNVLDIWEVRYAIPGPSQDYPLSRDWELVPDMSTEFTGSQAIMVRDAFPNRDVVIKGKYGFVPFPADLTTDLSTTLLPTTAYDILSIGAAYRLTLPREVKRNFTETQGDTRRSSEVPPGAELGGSRELARLRHERIVEEANRLTQKYSDRSRRPTYMFN